MFDFFQSNKKELKKEKKKKNKENLKNDFLMFNLLLKNMKKKIKIQWKNSMI